jgi:hypothetical protein
VSIGAFLLLGFMFAGLNSRALTFYLGGELLAIVVLGVFALGCWKATKDVNRESSSSPKSQSWRGVERRAAARTH